MILLRTRLAAVLLAFLVPLLASASAGPASGTALAARAAELDRPAVGDPVELRAPLRIGRAEIALGPAATARVLVAGGRSCGLWIDGPATFRYRVDDRFSLPIARRNLKSASDLRFSDSGSVLLVERQVRGAVVWGWEQGGGASAAASGSAPEFPAWATSALTRSLAPAPAQALLAAAGDGIRDLATVLLDDPDGVLRLQVDPLEARAETLQRLVEVPKLEVDLDGRLFGYELVEQPLGRPWWERFPDALVAVHRRVDVVQDGPVHARIRSSTRLRATRAGVSHWRAYLAPVKRDSEGHFHSHRIETVTVAGAPADWAFDRGALLVALPRALAQGEEVEVGVETSGDYALLDQNNDYWLLDATGWFPQGPTNGDLATLDLNISVPEPWTPIASGETVAETRAGGVANLHSRLDLPMQWPMVAVGNFHSLVEERDGVRVRVASYAMKKERESRLLLNNFLAARQFYENLLGIPYPFQEIDIVERNDWSAGMAPPGLIFITKEAFTPLAILRVEGEEGALEEVNNRFVHEIAHGWWAHVVKADGGEEGWINEGFSEYSAALCLEAMRGGGKAGEREFRRWVNRWKSYAGDLRDDASLYLADHLAGNRSRDETDRWTLRYAKGALVLQGLREELQRTQGGGEAGDRYFFALLRSFAKNANGRFGSTAMLVGILNQMTGRDWQPWFERYVYGVETPPVR